MSVVIKLAIISFLTSYGILLFVCTIFSFLGESNPSSQSKVDLYTHKMKAFRRESYALTMTSVYTLRYLLSRASYSRPDKAGCTNRMHSNVLGNTAFNNVCIQCSHLIRHNPSRQRCADVSKAIVVRTDVDTVTWVKNITLSGSPHKERIRNRRRWLAFSELRRKQKGRGTHMHADSEWQETWGVWQCSTDRDGSLLFIHYTITVLIQSVHKYTVRQYLRS